MRDLVPILYMEDNTTFAAFIKRQLQQAGYRVDIAEDGLQGLQLLQQNSYAIVLLDYLMPHCDGIEVITTLGKMSQNGGPALPIIMMLTGAGDEKIAVKAMKLGARDYLVKDSGQAFIELLLHAIQRLLHERQLELEKLQADQALAASEQRFRAAFNQTFQCMLLLQTDGTIISANDRACDMMKLQLDSLQLMQQTCWYQCAPPAAQQQIADALQQAAQGHTIRFETKLQLPHYELPLQVSFKPIRNDRGRIHLIVCEGHDISTHKAAESSLLMAKELAEQADRSKTEFLANISHELRTPLNAILGLSDFLLEEMQAAQDQVYLADVKQIQTAAKQLNGLVDDLLVLAKIEAGQSPNKVAPYCLDSLIQEVVAILQPKSSQKPVAIHIQMDPTVPERLIVDPIKLRHILLNLISNAIKFSYPNGNIVLQVKPIGVALPLSLTLHFTVTDQGIGIDAEDLPSIGALFTQGDGTATRQYGGTGLGLTIVKRLLGSLNSELQIKSQAGQGSEFGFEIQVGRVQGLDKQFLPNPANSATIASSERTPTESLVPSLTTPQQ